MIPSNGTNKNTELQLAWKQKTVLCPQTEQIQLECSVPKHRGAMSYLIVSTTMQSPTPDAIVQDFCHADMTKHWMGEVQLSSANQAVWCPVMSENEKGGFKKSTMVQ